MYGRPCLAESVGNGIWLEMPTFPANTLVQVPYVYMSRGRGGSRGAELTRREVIDAAAGLVAEDGYAGLTMRALARRQAVLERLPLDDFDNLSRLSAVFLLRSSDRHYEEGLDLIIRGLESKAG